MDGVFKRLRLWTLILFRKGQCDSRCFESEKGVDVGYDGERVGIYWETMSHEFGDTDDQGSYMV